MKLQDGHGMCKNGICYTQSHKTMYIRGRERNGEVVLIGMDDGAGLPNIV